MYRPQIILARNISIEVPRRRSSPEIAAANRDPSRARYWTQSIDCCARFLVSPFDEGPLRHWFLPVIARNYSAELVAHVLSRGH
jgi:hypothetical protein